MIETNYCISITSGSQTSIVIVVALSVRYISFHISIKLTSDVSCTSTSTFIEDILRFLQRISIGILQYAADGSCIFMLPL